ncbi:FHA domain-containing protein [Streptomyces sp. NPDC057702]|uniref:FHA domain-containing protein n=1 Tax=unclassified Streptomyces TaxID=2593676 RepID=UPI0036C9B352
MTSKVSVLPSDIGSLSRTAPVARPGTLFVLGADGGMSVAPDANFPLMFGRNKPDVHICVGAADPRVSRRQGLITRESSRWVLRNTGNLPIRLPGARLILGGNRAELSAGYTPLFIVSARQEHLLEVRVTAAAHRPGNPCAPSEATTYDGDVRELGRDERLVLACLAQRYLRADPYPQPLTWGQVAFELGELRPGERWTAKRAAHIVSLVRRRMSREYGVAGLLEEEIPPPVGNALNHNLITYLLETTTLTRTDLRELGQ